MTIAGIVSRPPVGVIAAVVDKKQRNPTWGCPRMAQQITLAFGIPMNKDVVRPIFAVLSHRELARGVVPSRR